MATKKNTRVRFLGGHAARRDLLGLMAFPVALDGHDVEHTRFFMTNQEKWVQTPFDCDIASVTYGQGPTAPCWWLLDKRGRVLALSGTGTVEEAIPDAGTGPGKLGYVNCIKIVGSDLFVCGYRRQVYQRTAGRWLHQDQGIILDEQAIGKSLNDMAGNGNGVLCAVGSDGEIAVRTGSKWRLLESPTNVHLYTVTAADAWFYAAGASGTVLKGNADGFEVLCQGAAADDAFWDIEFWDGEVVVSGIGGLFAVRDGALTAFDKPPAPKHIGNKLTATTDRLWSIGTHQVYCLDGGKWREWQCPDNQ